MSYGTYISKCLTDPHVQKDQIPDIHAGPPLRQPDRKGVVWGSWWQFGGGVTTCSPHVEGGWHQPPIPVPRPRILLTSASEGGAIGALARPQETGGNRGAGVRVKSSLQQASPTTKKISRSDVTLWCALSAGKLCLVCAWRTSLSGRRLVM